QASTTRAAPSRRGLPEPAPCRSGRRSTASLPLSHQVLRRPCAVGSGYQGGGIIARVHAASGRGRTTALTIEDVRVSVVRKRVKNVNLRVYPPAGDVVVSVPLRMSDSAVRQVLSGRLPWIRLQRSRYASAPPARFLEYVDGEEHRLFGRCYTLRLVHGPGRTGPSATDRDVVALHVRPFADHDARRRAHEAWLRRVLATEIERLV